MSRTSPRLLRRAIPSAVCGQPILVGSLSSTLALRCGLFIQFRRPERLPRFPAAGICGPSSSSSRTVRLENLPTLTGAAPSNPPFCTQTVHKIAARTPRITSEFFVIQQQSGNYVPQADFHDRSLSRGQKLSRRASEERGYKTLSDFSPRVLASQPWFLFQIEPDFHLLSQTSEWS